MRHSSRSARQTAIAYATSLTPASKACRLIGALLAGLVCAGAATISHAQGGKALFEENCGACHSIGGGPMAGPDLKGLVARRGKDGAVAAILDPAQAGLKESMPNLGLARSDVEAIVGYIEQAASAGPGAAAAPAAAAPAEPQPEEIVRGQALFDGTMPFAKGGPSCNACHHVTSEAVVGGGVLASELTLAFSRMGRQGMQAVLAKAPFPVMQVAYRDKGLTEDEIASLVAFLQNAEKHHARQMPKEYGWRIFSAGAGGVVVLVLIALLAGRRRKARSVNQDIYDRQIRSA